MATLEFQFYRVQAMQIAVVVGLLLPALSSGAAEVKDVGLAAFTSTRFEKVERLMDIPEQVRHGLTAALEGGLIADVGGAWSEGCLQEELPSRRLIFAGRSPRIWFVFFEQGGIIRQQRVISLRLQPNGMYTAEGAWDVEGAPSTIQELQAVVSAGGRKLPH